MADRIKRMRPVHVLLLLATISSNASAQVASFLVPFLPAQSVAGARGSLWSTDLMIENSSDHNIFLQQDSCFVCGRPPFGAVVNVPPHSTVTNPVLEPAGSIGSYLFISQADADAVRFHLRVRDMSRQSETFGTEIEVPSDSAFRPTVRLIDVPTDPRFRVTLRIYSRGLVTATVTVLPANGVVPLRTLRVPINHGAAALDPVSGIADPSVRLVIENGGSLYPIWAFASVTNNDTQDVTTINESR